MANECNGKEWSVQLVASELANRFEKNRPENVVQSKLIPGPAPIEIA